MADIDPNEVIGQPQERDVWLAPDWSAYKSVSSPQPSGWTRVSIRTTTYGDGRVVTQVLDENRKPITHQVINEEPDADQQRKWQAQQNNARQAPQPIAPGGVATRPGKAPDGSTHIYQYNPQTGNYDIDLGAAPATAGTKPAIPPGGSSSIEGTPDPSKPGGWDNERPRQVIRDKNNNVVWTEELTGADLTAWRAAQQANQPQSGEIRKPVEGRPGWTMVTRKTVQGGNTAETTVYIGPDGKEVPTMPADNKPTQAADGSWGYWDNSSGTPKWTPIANGPAGKKYTEVKQDPTTGAWSGLTADGKWEAIQGGPGINTGAGLKNIDPFMPDYSQPDLGISAWASRQAQKIGKPGAAGGITQAEYDSAVKAAHDQATVTVNNISAMTNVQRQQFIDEQNAKNKARDYTDSDIRRDTDVFNSIWRYTQPDSKAIMGWMPPTHAQAQAMRDDAAGHADMPPPLHPMFTSLQQRAGAAPSAPAVAMAGQQQALAAAPQVTADTTANLGRLATPPAVSASAAAAPVQAAQPAASTATQLPPARPDQTQVGSQIDNAIMPYPQPDTAPVFAPQTPATYQKPANQAPDYGQPGMRITPQPADGADQPAMPQESQYGPSGDAQSVMQPQQQGPLSAWANGVMGSDGQAQPRVINDPMALGSYTPAQGQLPMDAAAYGHTPSNPLNPALAGLAQQGQGFDPYDTAARLVRMGVPVEAVREAMTQMGHV